VQERFTPVLQEILDDAWGSDDGQMGRDFVCELKCAYKDRDDKIVSCSCVAHPLVAAGNQDPDRSHAPRFHIGPDVQGQSFAQYNDRSQQEHEEWDEYVRQAFDPEPRYAQVDDDRFKLFDEPSGFPYMPSFEEDPLTEPEMQSYIQRAWGEFLRHAGWRVTDQSTAIAHRETDDDAPVDVPRLKRHKILKYASPHWKEHPALVEYCESSLHSVRALLQEAIHGAQETAKYFRFEDRGPV
jgi:hypothetical protein